jgi:CubicO group peptidase (beta-lactamase class C family)
MASTATIKPDSIEKGLVPLPQQRLNVPWPTVSWPQADSGERGDIKKLTQAIFDLSPAQGVTYALLIIKEGELIYERYAAGANAIYLQYSWSMAKSITHALVGILARDGMIDIYSPAAVPEWQGTADPRAEITLDQLLRMSSGLEFNEDYIDGTVSDVIPMLSFEGRHDTGAFAAAKPLAHTPGTFWSYSSGTTNIICRILAEIIGNGPTGMLEFMSRELFEPLGMRTPTPRFDTAGTFIGSSFLLATPQDFARFGLLYLRDGIWDGQRILPLGWADYARSCTYRDEEQAYGAHWWLKPDRNWFYASGYDGQRILLVPDKDVIIVRCGRTPAEEVDAVWNNVNELAELV